jgi:serine/threonine protein kinase
LILGRYRLQRRLGAGAFGTVHEAHDERLDREVAVKVIPRERVMGGRFEREARAAARLAHPNIVTLYEAGADDDAAYLVSELVRGATLDDLLTEGRLSDKGIVEVGIALCDALEHAHSQHVIHRDVKPSNVLIPDHPTTPSSSVKLTDFGVARVVGGDSLTSTGDVIGTAAYMSPEQAEGLETGPAADLYSLALVLYEALTGVNPIRAATSAQRARRLGAHLPPLRRQRRELPRELGCGLDLALRPRPRERGTIAELRAALAASLVQVTDEPGIVTAPWRPARSQRRGDQQDWPPRLDFAKGEAPEPAVPASPQWPERAVAAVAVAGVTGWLLGHLLQPSPVAPAAGALLAAAAILIAPRIGWLAVLAAVVTGAVGQDHVGLAVVLALAGLLTPAALPRRGTHWPLPVAAPALAAIGLAGAWPAFAARAQTAYRRAALGAIGYVLIVLANTKIPGRVPAALWMSSPYNTLHHLLGPVLTSGALLPAVAWGAAAAALPHVATRSSLVLDVARTIVWAVLLIAATATLSQSSPPPSMMLGALLGAALTLAPTALDAYRTERLPARSVP